MPDSPDKPPSARAQIAQADTAEALARVFTEERARLHAANLERPQGSRSCRALTDLADQVIQRLLVLALPEDPAVREVVRGKIAVVATGGYGRRELCPFSDIDVTFVVAEEEDRALDATVRQMFLWLLEVFTQRGGLKVGYGYRTPADAPQLDHQTQTALLDARVVTGSNGLTNKFLLEVIRHIWPAAFVRRKVAERRLIIDRHGGTIHRIEPEIRESPGGLRDLHLAEWLAAVSFPGTRGDVWKQLQRLGVVAPRDVQDAAAAREFLLTVRNWMHWHTGRSADALLRERQEGLAEALGYQDDDHASRVERFMETYYLHAENAARVSGFVVDRCLSERLSISDELVCAANELFPAFPWVRVAQPAFQMEVARLYQELGLTPGHELRRMISQNLDRTPDLGSDPEAADDFVGLLRAQAPLVSYYAGFHAAQTPGGQKPGVYDTLGLLAELGILQRLIPEIGEAYRRVPFDQVHRHTIGYHSLQTVHSLERLRTAGDEKLRELVRIWGEVDAPELLYLAGLLHDVGKLGGSGHARNGAEMARDICTRLGLSEPHVERVARLVLHHLLMSDTAQLRDLTLDKTISDFTAEIDSLELLNMLILLTYADMEATGVLSPVKIRFLEDLYFRADHVLQQGQEAPQPEVAQDRARRFRSRLSRRLAAANLTAEQIREHTEGMPVSYLLNTRAEQIATHIRMVEALRASGPVVEFDTEPGSDITTMHVCTEELATPGLLSRIAGVLYAHEIAVHGAQVFTRRSDPPLALDTLWVDFRGRPIPPFKRLEVEQDLVAVLRGGDAVGVIERLRRHVPKDLELRQVRFDSEQAEQHTVIQIEADDQPALLYRLTRAMAALGWDIHSARISTMGDRARDVFYVTTRDGGKLDGDEAALQEVFRAELGCR